MSGPGRTAVGYGAALAAVYDQVYEQRGRDYAAEAADILAVVRGARPGARSVLDVGCGTGGHLQHFARCGPAAGLEPSSAMVDLARERLGTVPVHRGDMRTFDLGTRFDAVTCLFSTIGHMRDPDELEVALSRMAAHLHPGGVLVVEPWWFPEDYLPGFVRGDVSTVRGRTVARVSYSTLVGRRSVLEVHFTVADAAGIEHFVDRQEITLFERAEYESAFARAGVPVTFTRGGPSGRGLFVGVSPAG